METLIKNITSNFILHYTQFNYGLILMFKIVSPPHFSALMGGDVFMQNEHLIYLEKIFTKVYN